MVVRHQVAEDVGTPCVQLKAFQVEIDEHDNEDGGQDVMGY